MLSDRAICAILAVSLFALAVMALAARDFVSALLLAAGAARVEQRAPWRL